MFLCGIKKTLTTNFQFIETHQLHRVYFQWCNVSRLYKNSQFLSFSDSQFLNLLKLSKRVPVGHK